VFALEFVAPALQSGAPALEAIAKGSSIPMTPDPMRSDAFDVASAAAPMAAAASLAPAPDPNVCPICRTLHGGSDPAVFRRLAQAPDRLAKLLKGLDANGLKRTYAPGKWTIRQIVAHLRDCELVYGFRWRRIVADPDARLEAFDQDRWATGTSYARQDARRAVETLKLLRATNLELLKLAGKAALARSGTHAEYGRITAGQLARHILAHDENHLAQIEQARAAGKRGARRAKRR